ncbi:LOW QUALITY PROTEIN: hypothetical protein HID58_060726 [Brassica napus]|uniref:Uncharacterized protein n=1 Tax=Brassica napus TaxID=3708 RepID=A0ABQ7ZWK6_BRANA|nr:LOW QUALITY PROTEIN: hypothetical protein HID58_060726 [Brassica napus]
MLKEYRKQNKTFHAFAMEADKAFHEEYKVKKKRQLLPYAAWMFVEEVMELVELKPLKTLYLAFLKLMVRKRLTISVELVAISLIFMDEPTSSMQGLPPWLFLGHHIFKSVDEVCSWNTLLLSPETRIHLTNHLWINASMQLLLMKRGGLLKGFWTNTILPRGSLMSPLFQGSAENKISEEQTQLHGKRSRPNGGFDYYAVHPQYQFVLNL